MNTTGESFPSPEEIQRTLPRYHNIRLLSQTGMSLVYRAQERDLADRDVALKVLTPELANDPEFRERFIREVSHAASLRHPNIIPIYAGPKSPDGSLLYVAMPLVDGFDLGTLLHERGRLDLPETLRIVRQVAAALEYAHNRDLVHRDVKPGNIMLDRHTGDVYLCDFGIAKRLSTEQPLTQTGRFIGTPGYVSPEGINCLPVDRRADVYALGVVLYQCLAGRPPYDQPGNLAKLDAQLHQDPLPLTAVRADLPAGLDAVVAGALARRPQDRYASCQRFVDELTRVVGTPRAPNPPGQLPSRPPHQADDLSTPEVVREPTGRPRRPVPLLGAIAAVGMLAVIGAVVLIANLSGADDGSGSDVDANLLARVPAQLRTDCQQADTAPAGASARLRCKDVRFDLFGDRAAMDTAYAEAVRRSDIARSSGDCGIATDAEHRYPGVGEPVGRVLCYSRAGTAALVWSNDETRTVASVEDRDSEDIELERAWSRWVDEPGFPTEGERELIELVELDPHDCQRVAPSELDRLSADAQTGVQCDSDQTDSATRTISYYEFTNKQALLRGYADDVSEVDAPSNTYCADDPPPPGFLGNRRYDLRSVEIGGLLCHPAEHSRFVVEWTVEPMLLMGRATGIDSDQLIDWWNNYYGPPTEQIVQALNEQADPAFPTKAEQDLLGHIPVDSRNNCIRPPEEQIELNVGARALPSVEAAVVCGPAPGASIVFYYKFEDQSGLDESVRTYGSSYGQDCRDAPPPPDFFGYAPYTRDGDTAGVLACGTNDRKYPFLSWTNNELDIQVFAFQTEDVGTLLDWWSTTAGPL